MLLCLFFAYLKTVSASLHKVLSRPTIGFANRPPAEKCLFRPLQPLLYIYMIALDFKFSIIAIQSHATLGIRYAALTRFVWAWRMPGRRAWVAGSSAEYIVYAAPRASYWHVHPRAPLHGGAVGRCAGGARGPAAHKVARVTSV